MVYGSNEYQLTKCRIEELYEVYKEDECFRELLKGGSFIYVRGNLVRARLEILEKCEYGNTLKWSYHSKKEEYIGFAKDKSTGHIRFGRIHRKIMLQSTHSDYGTILRKGKLISCRANKCYKPKCNVHPWGEYDDPHTRRRIDSWLESLPEDAYAALTFLINECKVNKGRLASMLEVDVRTLHRWRTGETPMKLENLVAICLALQLPAKLSFALIKKFNAKDMDEEVFQPDTNEKHLFWEMLLTSFHMNEPKELNKLCKKNGYDIIFSEMSDVYEEQPRHNFKRSK